MNSGGDRVNVENQMDEQGSTPLGLKLRKSPSLIELIHLSMCQWNGESSHGVNNLTMEEGKMHNNGCLGANSDVEEKKNQSRGYGKVTWKAYAYNPKAFTIQLREKLFL